MSDLLPLPIHISIHLSSRQTIYQSDNEMLQNFESRILILKKCRSLLATSFCIGLQEWKADYDYI